MSLFGYTAASELPWKLLKCKDAIVDGEIAPYHIQLVPTNRCNGNCSWCSCKDVDREVELPIEEIEEILEYFAKLGAKAVTITGGGEPTLHPAIKRILEYTEYLGIESGMVTNGLKISNGGDWEFLNSLTWMRISIINTAGHYNTEIIKRVCSKLADVDVGISFTVTDDVNIDTARKVCEVAEETKNLTHIRFVQDIVNLPLKGMKLVEESCQTEKAIFQHRENYTKGDSPCYISKLKPVIDATGYIFPCCGVQYAGDILNCMPDEFKMCYWSDYHKAKHFNGTVCKKCYYHDYNNALRILVESIPHERFI